MGYSIMLICQVINNLMDYLINSGLCHCVWVIKVKQFKKLLGVSITTMLQILIGSFKKTFKHVSVRLHPYQ